MNNIPIHSEDLVKYYNDADIVHKTALQVIKDFNQFGFEIIFPDDLNMAYHELFNQLTPRIKDLLGTDMSKLFSLLYFIDLNENAIKKGLHELTDIPLEEVITHLLLERELKKVITREYFKRTGHSGSL
jgi:hypothetical protein